jgi:hypothetical protein
MVRAIDPIILSRVTLRGEGIERCTVTLVTLRRWIGLGVAEAPEDPRLLWTRVLEENQGFIGPVV